MAFDSGSVSFRRFAVVGEAPAAPDEALIDKLSANAIQTTEMGIPEETEFGWSGGRHILDVSFSFEHNVFGDAVHFAMRVDTNKVPGDLKRAYIAIEEEATASGNPSGFISKGQKKDVKDTVRRRLEDELREGRHRRSKLVPVLWDVARGVVYSPANGGNLEKLTELFERTFGLSLEPMTAGGAALRWAEASARRRDYEDSRPTRFVIGPEGESQMPEYPWVAKGPQPKDFLGNEFMLWLWHEADTTGGIIPLKGDSAGDITVMFDKSIDLDCAYGSTGKDALRGDGPTRMPEARDALRVGKLPRKAGLVIDYAGQQYATTLNPELFSLGGTKLPEVEDADTPRAVFEERISMLGDLCRGLDALYTRFLSIRFSSAWEGQTQTLRKWIVSTAKPVTPAITVEVMARRPVAEAAGA